jgi:fatty acid desaturase
MASMSESRTVYNGAPPASELVTNEGLTWLEYRKNLKPDYARAWRDAAFCYIMLFGAFALHIAISVHWGTAAGVILAPLAALWIGFWLHALNQFAHEGAHGNLARDRKRNDLLADWLLWPLFAQTVRTYRISHMQHHVHLGDLQDTEINYHECMHPWLITRCLTGIQLVVLVGAKLLKPKSAPAPRGSKGGAPSKRDVLVAVARTGLIHGLFIFVPAGLGIFGPALAWLIGLVAIYPFFGSTRQMLEHRAYDAPCKTDFSKIEHGAVNRHFGNDIFSRYFGAAGVNHHLLHHWDPAISYTRFADMEAFILRTPYAAKMEEGRTTYWRAVSTLCRTAFNLEPRSG